MQFLYEKIAYLRGMSEGLSIDCEKKEGKLLNAIIDVLEDFADAVAYLEDAEDTVSLDALDSNDFDFVCPNCNEPIEIEETSIESENNIICPKCKEAISISTQSL